MTTEGGILKSVSVMNISISIIFLNVPSFIFVNSSELLHGKNTNYRNFYIMRNKITRQKYDLKYVSLYLRLRCYSDQKYDWIS